MQAWKPFLAILPAGLLLGAIGGHYARREVTQHSNDSYLQSLFETRGQRYGTAQSNASPEEVTYDTGGYSYPPYLDSRMMGGDREITGWQDPGLVGSQGYQAIHDASAAQLEAQIAARDAALDDRAWLGASTTQDNRSPAKAAADAAAAAAADARANAGEQFQSGPEDGDEDADGPKVVVISPSAGPSLSSAEPRTADGALTAIW